MRIRVRLLVSFVSIALLVLVLFGAVAYRISEDVRVSKDIAALESGARLIAALMSERLARQPADPARIPTQLSNALRPNTLFVVHDRSGTLASAGHPTIEPNELTDQLLRAYPQADESGSGLLETDAGRYAWAGVAIPGSGLHVSLARSLERDDNGLVSDTALRLLITGGVVIWIAVWGALLVTSSLTRRLKQQHADLTHQALHDPLTGLPNRACLHQRIRQHLQVAESEGHTLALFLMDLDRFKDVNDTLGHHIGDQLLQEVGRRVREALRESDTVARLGGDEFAVLLPTSSEEEASLCADKIQRAFEQSVRLDGIELEIRNSIGIALYPQHGEDAETLMQHADVAMYQAKRDGGGASFYVAENDPHSLRRLTLLAELRGAPELGELRVHYQPIMDVSAHRVTSAEALVRWQHPELGFVRPDEFIMLAEQNGTIVPLTHWVIDEVLRQICAWRKQGMELPVAVNLSPNLLQDKQFPEYVKDRLAQYGVAPRLLEFEITENAIISDLARAMDVLTRLSQSQIRLAIDDFGTGMSSLAYLKRLPVDCLKIDKSFVMDMTEDDHSAVIVRTIIEMAHNMGRSVIAEGVENFEVVQLLDMLGCEAMQGYFISRPCAAVDLDHWLRETQFGTTLANIPKALAAG